MTNKTVLIRINEDTRHRLKISALQRKQSLKSYLDKLSFLGYPKDGLVQPSKKLLTVSLKDN